MSVRRRLAWTIALWFGCGRFPKAPGTAGSAGALPLAWLLRPYGPVAMGAAAVVVTVIGTWAANVVCEDTRVKDPQIVVVDEVAGMLVTFLALPASAPWWKGALAVFVAFRICDQLKPWPARAAERLPKGIGVMADDVLAAVWAAGLVWGASRLGWLA
jgi:phosphatidylglycerophosphatase A